MQVPFILCRTVRDGCEWLRSPEIVTARFSFALLRPLGPGVSSSVLCCYSANQLQRCVAHNKQRRRPKGPPGATGKPPATSVLLVGPTPSPTRAREGSSWLAALGMRFPRESLPRTPCKDAGAAAPGPRDRQLTPVGTRRGRRGRSESPRHPQPYWWGPPPSPHWSVSVKRY